MNSTITRVMAFDFGLRQIGVASANVPFGTTQPLQVVAARDGVPDWNKVQKLITEWQPELLLVGDPLNMDDSESPLAQRARRFGRRLHGRFGIEVVMVDERLSSFEAKLVQRERGHDGDFKRRPVDSEAAELILGTWLNEYSGGRTG